MDTEKLKAMAVQCCIEISIEYTEEEVKRFTDPSVQKAWHLGNVMAAHIRNEDSKKLKNFKL